VRAGMQGFFIIHDRFVACRSDVLNHDAHGGVGYTVTMVVVFFCE